MFFLQLRNKIAYFVLPLLLAQLTSFGQTYTVGAGTTVNTATAYPSPYGNYYGSARHQFLIRASELSALGMTAGKITSLGFNVSVVSGAAMQGFNISMKHTAATALNNTFETGLTQVLNPTTYTDVAGWNMHTFNNPFCWDGTSNIIVETCFSNPSFSNNARVFTTNAVGFAASHWVAADGASQCGVATSANTANNRPNIRLTRVNSTTDIGVTTIVSPSILVQNSGASMNISFVIKNFSCSGAISSAVIGYSWNNGPLVTDNWTGSLAVGATATVTIGTPLIANPSGFNSLKVFVNSPDGLIPDGNTANDELSTSIFVKGSGFNPPPTINLCSNDYWFTIDDAGAVTYNLVISSQYCLSGTIEMPAIGFTQAFSTTSPTTALTIALPASPAGQSIYHVNANSIEGKGIHVFADKPFSMSVVPSTTASVDGDFIYPSSMLGQEYVISSRANGIPLSSFNVGAKENGTEVLIGNSATNTYTSVTLNKGETYRINNTTINCNSETNISNPANYSVDCTMLTESYIVSNKPVYVSGYAPQTNLGVCGAADNMRGFHITTSLWGSKYVLGQSIKRNNPSNATCLLGATPPLPAIISSTDIVEIVGLSGTNVTITRSATIAGGGVFNAVIPTGPFGYGHLWYINPRAASGTAEEVAGACNLVISATNPIQVVQYSQGWQTDNQNFTDPEMIYVYPETFWQDKYIFATQNGLTSTNSSIVVVAQGSGTPPTTGWSGTANFNGPGWVQIGSSPYYFKRVAITLGGGANVVQTNTAGLKFGVYVNVVGAAESYTINMAGSCQDIVYPTPTSCLIAVSLDLVSFTGSHSNGKNVLLWSSTDERNLASFVVQRSNDLISFTDIGEVNAKGLIGQEKNNYTFTDHSSSRSINYYRLKITQKNGEVQYSSFVSIVTPGVGFELGNIYPTDNSVQFSYVSDGNQQLVFSLYNISGAAVLNHNFAPKPGLNKDIIQLPPQLSAGIYFAQCRSLTDGNVLFSQKIVLP